MKQRGTEVFKSNGKMANDMKKDNEEIEADRDNDVDLSRS
jgi:hypothetical protein